MLFLGPSKALFSLPAARGCVFKVGSWMGVCVRTDFGRGRVAV